ncbi:MAG: WhiB family transcriptional regulator [Streptosporangiales bacterium]|nr:WhiB family transcriptional regulator [Streptosporangiales bacterium]
MLPYRTDWIEAAACLDADPELFFPVAAGEAGERQASRAQRICDHCQVRRECLEYAMSNSQMHGIWGGTTPEDRIRARRQRADRRRRARRHEKAGAA